MSDNDEKGFNDDELEDIMNEIENLEKEFADEDESGQEEVTAETVQEVEAVTEEPEDIEDVSSNVTPISKQVQKPEPRLVKGDGMNLNLNFNVGGKPAQLTVDPEKGVYLAMEGVEVVISESEGCTMTMSNGMTFSMPFDGQKVNKKAA